MKRTAPFKSVRLLFQNNLNIIKKICKQALENLNQDLTDQYFLLCMGMYILHNAEVSGLRRNLAVMESLGVFFFNKIIHKRYLMNVWRKLNLEHRLKWFCLHERVPCQPINSSQQSGSLSSRGLAPSKSQGLEGPDVARLSYQAS